MKIKQSLTIALILITSLSFTTSAPSPLKLKPYDLGFTEIIPEKDMKRLNMLGGVNKSGVRSIYGKMLRAIRFQNITEKVENRYNLPKNILLAMIMHESSGVDLLPNGSNDGGLGLCHMQPLLASQYGLKTYQNNKALRSVTHGKALRKLIFKHKHDRKKLIQFDDRFHPILNLDAAGRILAYHMRGNKHISVGVKGYAGSINYPSYWKRVKLYLKYLNNSQSYINIEKAFNAINPNLLIGGEKGDYKLYIKTHQDQNINYGLNEYR